MIYAHWCLMDNNYSKTKVLEPALEELLILADQLTATDILTGLELADAAVETAAVAAVESSEDVITAEEMLHTEVEQEAAADASLLAETLAIL